MILRHHCGFVVFFIAYLSSIAYTDVLDDEAKLHQRLKRDSTFQSDPKTYLDQVIDHLIFTIPTQIDESIGQSKTDLRLTVAKRVTQGWSIVLASWKDILSDYVENKRTLGNLGDMSVVYNYGFLFTYGIGFGFPLLLGLPEEKKSCSQFDFLDTLGQYELDRGVAPLLARGASPADIASVLSEFQLVVGTKLSCIDSTENLQSQIVTNSVNNLLAAMNARLELELLNQSAPTQYGFQARKLSGNTFEDETPQALLAENAAIVSVI